MSEANRFPKSPYVGRGKDFPPDGPEHIYTYVAHSDDTWVAGVPSDALDLRDLGADPLVTEQLTVTVRYRYHGRDWAIEDLERAAPYIMRSLMDNLNLGLKGLVDAIEDRERRRVLQSYMNRMGADNGD